MSGMSEPKVVHRLRVWHGVFCNIWERLRCSTTKQTRRHCTCTRTRNGQSVSCTEERCGSHMLDCSVAKQSLVALSPGEAEFYGIVKAVVTSKQPPQILDQIGMQLEATIASNSSAARAGLGPGRSKSCGHRKRIAKGNSSWCWWTRS